ncbi:TolC family protein [Pontibacter mangrovi]|uniref:TolC family protein n=1 Tax=Pontibacter mangrovi TaxID=2589816 RepID=A0A501W0C2_9BACT|nr:TolC family protein [Pontibacter mangrovi]
MRPAFAQEPATGTQELSLQQAIEYALSNNQDVKKATYDEEIGTQQIRQARSQGLPQVNVSGGLDYYPALPTQLMPPEFGGLVGRPGEALPVKFGKDYNASANVRLTQLLYNQSYFVGLKAAKTTQDLYRLRKEMAKEDLIYNIGTAYYQTLQTKEQFETIEANLERLTELARIMELQYKNDLVAKVDVNRIKVNKTNLENQLQSLTTAYEQQKNILKFFMNMPLDQEITLTSAEGSLDNVVTEAITVAQATTQKTQYQLLQTQKQLQDYSIKNTQAGYYPTLSAYGQYGYNTQRDELFGSEVPWFKTSVVGLQLNIPIFDGFRKDAQVKQGQLEMQKIEQDMSKLEANTAVELTNALAQLQNSQRSIEVQQQNVDLAQEVYNTTNERYKEGISPLTDLLEAEVSLREAKTNLNNENLKYKVAQLNYLKARGELDKLIQ